MSQPESKPWITEAATDLAAAWRSGTTIASPLRGRPSASRADALALQDETARLIGGTTLGWHVDLAVKRHARARLEDGRVYGRIFAARCFDGPTTVPAGLFEGARVSAGFAFRMRRIVQRQKTPYTIKDIIESLHVQAALEIATSRISPGADGDSPSLLDVIADNGGMSGFVLGRRNTYWEDLDLATHPIEVRVDDGAPVANHEPPLRCDPLAFAAEFANDLAARQVFFDAGDVMVVGAVSRSVPLVAGQTLTASFGRIGALKLRLT
jgi:2-keto-4-pentenoate hydratase